MKKENQGQPQDTRRDKGKISLQQRRRKCHLIRREEESMEEWKAGEKRAKKKGVENHLERESIG